MKARIILTTAVFFALICVGAYADITTGLVSMWRFEGGSAKDTKGINNGTVNGATKAAGKFGECLSFDGTNDYVLIPDSPSLQLPEGLTVAAWINVKVSADHGGICAKHKMIGWGANFSFRIATATANTITWGRCKEGAENYFATDNVLPGLNQWVHVAMTCMAPGGKTNQRAYVNGKDITDVTGQTDNIKVAPPFLVFAGTPVEIGVGRGYGGVAGDDRFFNGLIDEVMIYSRGLTAADITQLVNADPSTAVKPSGKIASVWGEIKN